MRILAVARMETDRERRSARTARIEAEEERTTNKTARDRSNESRGQGAKMGESPPKEPKEPPAGINYCILWSWNVVRYILK